MCIRDRVRKDEGFVKIFLGPDDHRASEFVSIVVEYGDVDCTPYRGIEVENL